MFFLKTRLCDHWYCITILFIYILKWLVNSKWCCSSYYIFISKTAVEGDEVGEKNP